VSLRALPPEPVAGAEPDPGGGPVSRRRAGRLRQLYLTLRTEHTTPSKVGLAVGVGVFIGLSPFWFFHFLLCLAAAALLRLNRVLVYAAANVANPLTAPLLIFAEVQVGHRLLRGQWLGLSIRELGEAGVAGLFLDFLLGGILLGLVLGGAFGLLAYFVSRASTVAPAYQAIVDDVVRRYLDVSVRDAEAARGRLLRDPMFPFLIQDAGLARGRVLDLGCGRGLAAAATAGQERSYTGVDVSGRYVRVAREALAGLPRHTVIEADLRDFDPPPADVVLLLNVLRYLPVSSQDALLRRLGKALPSGARLLVREIDASRGVRFFTAVLKDWLAMLLLPARPRRRLHCRRAADLKNALVAAGFEVRDLSTAHTTPRARVLLEAVRRSVPAGAR
jgi:uncharacterized protein (DUF2062 family)/2-polyprenyl-3-methyl-5-hydroxy-6-metoxy-1,4-benzoquinol methylase